MTRRPEIFAAISK
jgi:hypothetical protein